MKKVIIVEKKSKKTKEAIPQALLAQLDKPKRNKPQRGWYQKILKGIEQLMILSPAKGTPESNLLKELAVACARWEKITFPNVGKSIVVKKKKTSETFKECCWVGCHQEMEFGGLCSVHHEEQRRRKGCG